MKPTTTESILTRIVASRVRRVAQRKREVTPDEVRALAAAADPPRDFAAAIGGGPPISLIAEIKRASPSRGPLREDLDPSSFARLYEEAGAAAVSVITEPDFFSGSDRLLVEARQACRLPVLRKDFLVDPYQLYEARALGADAVLLIVAALDRERLEELLRLAESLGMAALVETHTVHEIGEALAVGASIIGINNRDLCTMEVDIRTTGRLINALPARVVAVSESGIHRRQDMEAVERMGAGAALVGEAIVRTPDPREKIHQLLGRA